MGVQICCCWEQLGRGEGKLILDMWEKDISSRVVQNSAPNFSIASLKCYLKDLRNSERNFTCNENKGSGGEDRMHRSRYFSVFELRSELCITVIVL